MVQNKYLEVLGLWPGATEQEVKAAYRKLSKRYHPDINNNKNAHERFIEISEAYNFLIKMGPNPKNEQTNYNYDPYVAEYQQWRNMAREKARHQAREEAGWQNELIKKIFSWFNFIAAAIIFFNILLLLDYFLPARAYKQQIMGINKIYELSNSVGTQEPVYKYDEMYFEDFNMRFNQGEFHHLDYYDKARVMMTFIFKKPISVIINVDGLEEKHEQILSLFHLILYIIPLICLALLLYFFGIKTPDHRLTLSIVICFLTIIQVYMFFQF